MDVTGYVGNLELLHHALQSREEVRDEVFDAIYPIPYRLASEHFWTPVATARRAAELLVESRREDASGVQTRSQRTLL